MSSVASALPRVRPAIARRDDPRVRWLAVAGVATLLSLGVAVLAAPNGLILNLGGWTVLRRFLAAARYPALSAEFLWITAEASATTLGYAVLGASLAVVVGLVFGILSSESWWETAATSSAGRRRAARWGWLSTRLALSVPRGLHEAVWGLLLIMILGLDPLVAVLAIGIPYGAITAKVFSELLDEQPRGTMRSLRGAGATRSAAILYGLLPGVLPDWTAYALYRFECSIRASAVLGIIGAGGLGYQLRLSLQSLRYEELWTLLAALFLLNGATDAWSGRVRRRMGRGASPRMRTPRRDATGPETGSASRADPTVRSALRGTALVWLVSAPLAWLVIGPSPRTLLQPTTRVRVGELIQAAWPPRFDPVTWDQAALAAVQTLSMSVLAIVGASVLGLALALPAARSRRHTSRSYEPERARHAFGRVLRFGGARAVLLAMRTVPAPIWALAFLFVLFPGVVPGALALAIYTGGIVGRLAAEVLETMDDRPGEALLAAGASNAEALAYATMPAALPRFTAYAVYRWEECIRATAIVGLVGAGGLGRLLEEQRTSFDFDGMSATIVVFIVLTLAVDIVSARVRRSLR